MTRRSSDVPFGERITIGLKLDANLSNDQWRDVGLWLARCESGLHWGLADWRFYGIQPYGERKAIAAADNWSGPTVATLNNYACVARAFAKTSPRDDLPCRRAGLGLSHHREVVTLPPDQTDALLDEAAREGLTRLRLAGRVNQLSPRFWPNPCPEGTPLYGGRQMAETSASETLLDTVAAAKRLGVSPSFLAKARMHGDGPRYRKLGRAVRYAPADLDHWLLACSRTSTAEEATVTRAARKASSKA
jgi:hypothetical protein